jgi:hypothetical protein
MNHEHSYDYTTSRCAGCGIEPESAFIDTMIRGKRIADIFIWPDDSEEVQQRKWDTFNGLRSDTDSAARTENVT